MPRRPQMLASEVRTLIAPVLRQCPPECGIVTITAVEVSPDSSVVVIRVSALREHAAALAFMEKRKRALRHLLKALHMHRLPALRFEADFLSEQGSRIEKILQTEEEQ